MFRKVKHFIIEWLMKDKIDYLENMILYSIEDADVKRDGRSEDFYFGKKIGIEVALFVLCGSPM